LPPFVACHAFGAANPLRFMIRFARVLAAAISASVSAEPSGLTTLAISFAALFACRCDVIGHFFHCGKT
jgi:hypothetical protein